MLLSGPLRFDDEPELCDWWIWRSGGPLKLPQRGPGAGAESRPLARQLFLSIRS